MNPRSGLNPSGALWLTLLAMAYVGAALMGMEAFALQHTHTVLLWLPAGLGLIMVQLFGTRVLVVVFVASFAAQGLTSADLTLGVSPWIHGALTALANTLGTGLAAHLLRRHLPGGLLTAKDLVPFSFYVCLLPSLLTGVVVVGNLAAGDYLPWRATPAVLTDAVIAHSLGILLVWPVFQLSRESPPNLRTWCWVLLALALNGLLFAITIGGYGGTIFMILPVLLLLTIRAGPTGVVIALLVTIAALVATSVHIPGPCVRPHAPEARPMLMGYVLTITYVTLTLCLYYRELLASNRSRERWEEAALKDSLTELANRRALMKALGDELSRTQRTGRPFALAMLDIDHFKRINDNHGHQAGDRVLQAVSRVLRSNCREIDTVARIGGEEFAILMPETSIASSRPVMERILAAVSAIDTGLGGPDAHLTISIGLVDADDGGHVERLMREADARLYRAKGEGRNCIVSSPGRGP